MLERATGIFTSILKLKIYTNYYRMEEQTINDYYQILECNRKASDEEIKKSYKRLVLQIHPDKLAGESNEEFLLLQKAWTVLKDPDSRRQYDAMLTCQEHTECLLYDNVLLSDMTFGSDEGGYTYPCRCGGTYLLSDSDSMQSSIVIGCDECSFSIQVNRT